MKNKKTGAMGNGQEARDENHKVTDPQLATHDSRPKLKDIQSQPDYRNLGIDKVGVKDIRYPIVVLDKKNRFQHTIANVNMYVDLPHHFKCTHMIRFIEI